MSRFFSEAHQGLTPYVPGEQPKDRKYIKLNTNESPFPPSPGVAQAAAEASEGANLYSDPESTALREEMSRVFGVEKERIMMTNGSDEALNMAFMAFASESRPLLFPDVTYGFYKVLAELNRIPYTEIPLKEDFTIDTSEYAGRKAVTVLANPNAPTGILLGKEEVEKLVSSSPESVFIIDEAYIDFGGESAKDLIYKYGNFAVIGTFSKSRSLAGGRIGYVLADPDLISDLNRIRYSLNPYNVSSLSSAAGSAALRENGYYMNNCAEIIRVRERTAESFEKMSFELTDSSANFIFAKSKKISGKVLNAKLRERGFLVRRFDTDRIKDYNRITIGREEDMNRLVSAVKDILEEL